MKILIAGDFVPCHRIASQIEAGDYSCLDEVSLIIQSADYAIVNFESPVVRRETKPIVKTGPNLKCTAKAIECVANAGFNCVTLANNHFRDYGQVGVEDTINACIKNKVDYVGGGRDKHEAVQTLYRTIKGQTLAIVNVCENEWSIATDNYGGSAPLNLVQNYYSIKEAKHDADYVLVIVHGGIECYQYPTPRMQETYRFFIDAGADAVVNHHQHCHSGFESYKDKPIFYGLGNFCFDKPNSNSLWQYGYFVSIGFDEIISSELYPYYQGTLNNAGVDLLKDEEKELFLKKLEQINHIISSPSLLEQKFKEFSASLKRNKLQEFEPFSNRIIRALQTRGLLPSFVSNKTRLDTYDLINCESHREVILEILNNVTEENRWKILLK